MAKEQITNNIPKMGMNREISEHLLDEKVYSFMLNGNTEDFLGDRINLINEPSNLLTVRFPEGYKVLGYRSDINSDRTYFILVNPTSNYSSIGYVSNIQNLQSTSDVEIECEDCNYFKILSEPLENQTQVPSHTYVELLNDSCNGDLNLNINFPIRNIEIKTEKLGTVLYWADNRNPDRYLNVDNIDYYKYTGEIICGEDLRNPTCIDVEKLLLSPNYTIPKLEPETLQIGGNLKQGTYSFSVAYCDIAGNEITQYSTPTNPISIFDENNNILTQQELNQLTSFAIKIRVLDLDTRFKYYKVIVIERVNLANAESYYVEGVHPTTDDTILYTTSASIGQNNTNSDIVSPKPRTTIDNLLAVKTKFEKSRGVVSSNNYLFRYGLTAKKQDNLQPVVNLMGAFLQWQSSVANENLYKSAIATSKYKGNMRDEVQPYAIRFLYDDGGYSSNFPLVARPALSTDLEDLTYIETGETKTDDLNLKSIWENSPNCSQSDRKYRWQVYNTATQDKVCTDFTEGGTIITESTERSCIIEPVYTIPQNSYILSLDDDYTNLKSYINDNLEEVTDSNSDKYLPEVSNALSSEYIADNCTPLFEGECDSPSLVSSNNSIGEVINESAVYTEKTQSEYIPTLAPDNCVLYKTEVNNDGRLVNKRDTAFEEQYMDCTFLPVEYQKAYFRSSIPVNENCIYAQTIPNGLDPTSPPQPYFNNYYGSTTIAGLLTPKVSVAATDFQTNLHKGAVWFKIERNNREKLVFEITKTSTCSDDRDDIPAMNKLRYTFYSSCSSTSPIVSTSIQTSKVIDSTVGELLIMEDLTGFPSSSFYVAIDVPLIQRENCAENTVYRTAPPCGCFSVSTRDIEFSQVVVDFDGITIDKRQVYVANCDYLLPEVNDCDPIPYASGKSAYWESLETYPDNAELYDSSKLKIQSPDLVNLTSSQRADFENYFVQTKNGINYTLKEDTNLQCKPIRHFKFPDNRISPFMNFQNTVNFSEALIFPLGVHLSNSVVNTFLDIAVRNNLISQERRNTITGFEILKGDNSVNKSIITNALGYDMYKYTEKNKDVFYANYPHNDLGRDLLHTENNNLIEHPNGGNSNSKFSLISPELIYSKPALPTEMVLSGYQLGNSRGYFQDVEEHSRWVILSNNAKRTATTLATIEAVLEAVIKSAELLAQTWFVAGLSSGASLGAVGSGVAAAGYGVSSVMRVGKYRLQWLTTIRDLGSPEIFASVFASEGYHNKFLKNQDGENYVRALSVKKYLREGNFIFTDEHSGEPISINNFSRENSVFTSLGNYEFEYNDTYKFYDNNTTNSESGSRTIASQNGCDNAEVIRNVGSPYFTLKNYLPSQYGTIDSIQWLTTNYFSELSTDNSCEVIYGGTVFISRFTYKRKIQLFNKTAFGLPDKLPFKYSNYQNIAKAKYYVDYENGGGDNLSSALFPDIDSNYELDCFNRGQFYIRKPSKFYLYYYGIANYLVESEINCNFRYGLTQPKDQFYPQSGDLLNWVQEKNVSIKEPNTFYYNNVYSLPVYKSPYTILDRTYSKEVWNKKDDSENGVIYSLPDNSENDLVDPWLIYRPLDRYEFPKKYGKLISLRDLESAQILGRFENQQVLFNAVDNLANELSPSLVEIGTGGIFTKRPIDFKATDLGFAGTQHTDMSSTPYGHFTVDAKRGKIFQLDQNGRDLQPISDVIGGRDSGLKNWFREQLPFKILRTFPDIDIDNKFKGIGISMGWDARFDRVFITKKDYIVKNTDCLKYSEEDGFYTDCGEEGVTCPTGYTYNGITNMCERTVITPPLCPDGYIYDSESQTCTLTTVTEAECTCTADVTTPSQITCSGTPTEIELTSTSIGVSFNWTAVEDGVTGATSGSGMSINQTLIGKGTVVYTVTPFEIESGCEGTPTNIIVTVNETPNVTATPSSLTIESGSSAIIELTSEQAGTTFSWTVNNSGTTGAVSGTGSTINQVITGEGTTTYTIIPTLGDCIGESVNVVVTVESTFIPCDAGMDVAFLMDYTGSMGTTINNLKTNISTIVAKIVEKSGGDYRLSLTLFDEYNTAVPRNYGEAGGYTSLPSDQKHIYKSTIGNQLYKYITTVEKFDLNNELSFSGQLGVLNTAFFPLGSGDDTPEPATYGLTRVVDFDISGAFRPTVSKLVIIATDAETNESVTGEIAAITQSCIDKGIKVMLLNVNSTTKPILQNLATVTGGVIANGGVTQIITALGEICE